MKLVRIIILVSERERYIFLSMHMYWGVSQSRDANNSSLAGNGTR